MKTNNMEQKRDGANQSLWHSAGQAAQVRPKTDQQLYDAVIIGGGITGITTALTLQRMGRKCVIIEARNLGFGTTGGTSAHLDTFLDATYPEIDTDFGEEASTMLATASKETIREIERNINELGIDADFKYRDGYLFSQNEKETKQLDEIFKSAQRAGTGVEASNENGLPIKFKKSIRFPLQAQFHPVKYILGLAGEFQRLGGDIFEQSFVQATEYKDQVHLISTAEGTLRGKNLIWATHIPPGINILSLRNAPYRSYVLGIKLTGGEYPGCLSYDMQEPFHYFRTTILMAKSIFCWAALTIRPDMMIQKKLFQTWKITRGSTSVLTA